MTASTVWWYALTWVLHSIRQLLSDCAKYFKPYQFMNHSLPSTPSLQAHSSQLL